MNEHHALLPFYDQFGVYSEFARNLFYWTLSQQHVWTEENIAIVFANVLEDRELSIRSRSQ